MNEEEIEILEQGYLIQLAKTMKTTTSINSYKELKAVYLKTLEIIDKLIELEKSKGE